MKAIVFFVLISLEGLIGLNIPQLPQEEESCLTDLHLDREKILKIHFKQQKEEYNEDYNAFLTCCYKKKGFMDDEGNLNSDTILLKYNNGTQGSYFVKKALEIVVRTCTNSSGKDKGHTAVLVENCMSQILVQNADN